MRRNKSITGIFLHLFILCTVCAKAQLSELDHTFFAGAVLGANYSQVDGDNFAGYFKMGLNTGLITFAKFSNHIAGSVELLYSPKGSKASGTQVPRLANDRSTVLTDYKIQLNYLEVPVLLNFFDKRGNHFGAGISYNQLVRSRETYRDGFGNLYENDSKLYPFRKMDVEGMLDVSLKVWKQLHFDIRYAYSLVYIRQSYNWLTGRPPGQVNNLWTTRFVYMF